MTSMVTLYNNDKAATYLECHKGGEGVGDEDAGDAEGDHEEGADEEDELPAEVVGDGAEDRALEHHDLVPGRSRSIGQRSQLIQKRMYRSNTQMKSLSKLQIPL